MKKKWRSKITGQIYEEGETYTTVMGIQRRIVGVRRYITKDGKPFFKLLNNVGAELEEVEPI